MQDSQSKLDATARAVVLLLRHSDVDVTLQMERESLIREIEGSEGSAEPGTDGNGKGC